MGGAAFLVLLILSSANPFKLDKPAKAKHVKMIVEYAEEHDHDPYELLAIAITESSLNPKAVSWAGAIGLFQIMCKYWAVPLKYKTVKKCEKELLDPYKNMEAGVHVLNTYRNRYAQCKGSRAYRCYYAGPRWQRRTLKTKEKIARYEKKVLRKKKLLHKYYRGLIESIRSDFRARS